MPEITAQALARATVFDEAKYVWNSQTKKNPI